MTSLSDRIITLIVNWTVLILSPVWVVFFIISHAIREELFKDIFITGKMSIAKEE